MKTILLMMVPVLLMILSACGKEQETDRFTLLTAHVWASDSLLANGVDASGPGEKLEKFKGDATFNKDGTGSFGQYTGTWMLVDNDANLAISSPDLPVPSIATTIVELKSTSLKVKFVWPDQVPLNIRMTFKPK
jgi:hypothetical protein